MITYIRKYINFIAHPYTPKRALIAWFVNTFIFPLILLFVGFLIITPISFLFGQEVFQMIGLVFVTFVTVFISASLLLLPFYYALKYSKIQNEKEKETVRLIEEKTEKEKEFIGFVEERERRKQILRGQKVLEEKKVDLLQKLKPYEDVLEGFAKKYLETTKGFHEDIDGNKNFIYALDSTSIDDADLFTGSIVPKDESKMEKLADLLHSKYKLNIPAEDLSLILPEYYKKAKINEFEQIFTKTAREYSAHIERYVTYFGERCATRENFLSFYEFLKKNDLVQKNKIGKVAWDIITNIKKQELDSFEKQLKSDTKITLNVLDKMDGKEFENTLKTIFENQGYKVNVTAHSHDQGADLILEKFGKKIAVQAKRYENGVPNKAVQEIVAAKNHYGCDEAWVVTNSYLTQSAIELAESNTVRVIDRDELKKML